ncbi:F-box/kelch-repeat protein at1g57790 [Phtheirospermum japonicum]|uniref:F-box/kelch-repeat protein at1g57790 n=1 Tax=Phtheirospermum japonicum TaxID=374723 RepID=A0A830CH45_9LAMI|nr:F-box/kelch-repeat protein at1g57790 [Phtheirospermum japonicum]
MFHDIYLGALKESPLPPLMRHGSTTLALLTDIIIGGPRGRRREGDVPVEVLESILSLLNLRDNIRSSAVCRRWLAAAVSVRRPNRPPLLMYFPKHSDLHEFYDPSDRRTHRLVLPELRGCRILYAKDRWLLLARPSTLNVFFFCPYTRETIALPELRILYQKVAFSSAPTSPDCVVFAVAYDMFDSIISIRTCRPGATHWNSWAYNHPRQFIRSTWHQVVFSSARIYCLHISGQVGVFNRENDTWKVYVTPPNNLSVRSRWSDKFMAEHNGEMYVVRCCAATNPVIYRFNEGNETWTEVGSLGGMTLFANASSSLVRTDLVGKLAGNVVFPKVLLYGSRCVTYFPNHGRYYPRNQLYNWDDEQSDSVWIDAPADASIFL